MAIEFFTIEPSADIYLSLGTPEVSTVTLRLWVYDSVNPPRYVTLPDPAVSFAQSRFDIIDNMANDGKIQAKNAGTSFVRVTLEDTVNHLFHQMILRVSVFPDFARLWLGGNGTATVHDGRDDLVVSVYAQSPAGDFADITGHGFMKFSSLNQGVAVVDPDTGRVFGLAIGMATIRGQFKSVDYDTEVEVIPAFGEPREIVEKIWYNGYGPEYKNFLFMAEGFADSDYGKFKRIVQHIASRMRRSKVHDPYRLLKRSYNIWAAFEPSKESGVSVGPLVDANTGQDPHLDSKNPPQRRHKPLQVRASRLGLMYGQRMGDRMSDAYPGGAQAHMDNSWYDPVGQFSFFYNDPRRTSTNITTWRANMFEYLGSLKTTGGSTDLNYDIGQKWDEGAADQGHVIVIVNDDHLSGNYPILDSPLGGDVPVGRLIHQPKAEVQPIASNTPGIDHRPSASSLREGTVAVAIHELSHSFFLGDEYEGVSPFPGTDADVAGIEWSYNTTTRAFFVAGGIPYVKWAEIKRVSRSSAVLRDATGSAAATIDLQLFPGEGSKWSAGTDTYLLEDGQL